MKTSKQDREILARERSRHHEALEKLASSLGKPGQSGVGLWRKLRRLEATANQIATAYCNGDDAMYHVAGVTGQFRQSDSCESWEAFCGLVQLEVSRILGKLPAGFFVNGDARGYALKISPPIEGLTLHQDWGSNQILAPVIE